MQLHHGVKKKNPSPNILYFKLKFEMVTLLLSHNKKANIHTFEKKLEKNVQKKKNQFHWLHGEQAKSKW